MCFSPSRRGSLQTQCTHRCRRIPALRSWCSQRSTLCTPWGQPQCRGPCTMGALGAGPGAIGTRLVFIVALGARVAQLTCVTLVAFALAVALARSRAFAPAMPVTWVLSSSCARIAVGAIVVFRAASFSLVDAQVLVQIGLLVLMLKPPLFQVFLVLCGHVSAMLLALDYLQAEVLLDFDEPNLTFRVFPHIPGLPVDVSSIEATPFVRSMPFWNVLTTVLQA
uniref:Uncharacterized protein n=1 Tax=Rhipicephalus microplus TaxID=6941 RepID=A0A6G5AH58_RHIMP